MSKRSTHSYLTDIYKVLSIPSCMVRKDLELESSGPFAVGTDATQLLSSVVFLPLLEVEDRMEHITSMPVLVRI